MTPDRLNQTIDKFINSFILGIFFVIQKIWFTFWPYIIIALIIILAGMIIQILMLKSGGHRTLSPNFNRLVGSLTYFLFFGLIFIIGYWIFGTRVVDDLWFAIFGALAFPATYLFLRAIRFWYY